MTIQHIKNIFAPFFAGSTEERSAAVAYGMSLAELADAHLTVRGVSTRVESMVALLPDIVEPIVGPANEANWAAIDKATDAARRSIERRSLRHDVAAVQRCRREVEQLLQNEARVHDLTIVDADIDQCSDFKCTENLLFSSGRPVLVIPRNASDFRCDAVVVAYDGSHTATRAVADAMPFLQQAKKVKVLQVVDDVCCQKPAGAHLADALNRHGVIADFDEIERADREVPEIIESYVLGQLADLLVMGAYAHWRWQEAIRGGVTRAVMADVRLPTLMSH